MQESSWVIHSSKLHASIFQHISTTTMTLSYTKRTVTEVKQQRYACACIGEFGVETAQVRHVRCGDEMLPGLSSNQPEVQIIEEGRSLVAHGDPVLID